MRRFLVPVLLVLVVGLAGVLGYVMGDSSDSAVDEETTGHAPLG